MVTVALITTPEIEQQNYGKYRRWPLMQEYGGELGLTTVMVSGDQPESELVAALAGVEVVVPLMGTQGLQGNIDLMPVELARKLPDLKLVQLLSAGSNELDIQGLAQLGITVANNGGANAIPVAEHAIALMLSVSRCMMQQWETLRSGRWAEGVDYASFSEMEGKTVGICGFGNIGRQVARRLSGFGVSLIFYDILELPTGRSDVRSPCCPPRGPAGAPISSHPQPSLGAQELGARAVESLEELLRQSDIVTLHVPLSPSTVGLIGAEQLAMMRPHAILIK